MIKLISCRFSTIAKYFRSFPHRLLYNIDRARLADEYKFYMESEPRRKRCVELWSSVISMLFTKINTLVDKHTHT